QALPQHMYYRALSLLSGVQNEVEKALHHQATNLFNRDISLVFYDLTSSYFEGTHCKMAKRGYSREHRPDLAQIEIGLMVDSEGLPIGHQVYEGNVNDVCTVIGTLDRLKKTFGICRCVLISDDGMASKANLEAIANQGYEFITSLSLGRSKIADQLLAAHRTARYWDRISGSSLRMKVLQKDDGERSYVGTYNPERARASRQTRRKQYNTCREGLVALNAPPKPRAKAPTAEGRLKAADKLLLRYHARSMFIVTTTDDGLLKWTLDRKAVRKMGSQDGILVLVTNSKTLTPEEVAHGYRTLWRVENAFRHMKGDIGLRPIRHWKDSRVLGHVSVCVLAYLIDCIYDRHLQKAGLNVSTHTALGELSKIITATLVCDDERLRRRSEITSQQKKLLNAAGVTNVPEIW
ncbi:MAG: IS1634 family transposase, partial [Ktedonobacteraceae bacterium]